MIKNKQHGFIALTSILIIGAVVLLVAVGVSLRAIGQTDSALAKQQAARAESLANLCAETALFKLESVLGYTGNEEITVGDETCRVLAVEGAGNHDRIVKTQSQVGGFTRKVKVEIGQISPVTQVDSWQTVADF